MVSFAYYAFVPLLPWKLDIFSVRTRQLTLTKFQPFIVQLLTQPTVLPSLVLISIFPFELLLLRVSPLFRFIRCRHGNQGPCCASTKLNLCDMIGTSFVPSFNVIGQIFLKIEPEECFSKLRVNYHLELQCS
jgi:hypothetical protein